MSEFDRVGGQIEGMDFRGSTLLENLCSIATAATRIENNALTLDKVLRGKFIKFAVVQKVAVVFGRVGNALTLFVVHELVGINANEILHVIPA